SATVAATRGSQIITGGGTDVVLGTGGAKQVRFTDADGTVATLKLTKGAATLSFSGTGIVTNTVKGIEIVSGSGLVLSSITGSGTTAASSLTITTKGGDGRISVGRISTDGSFKTITAKTTDLSG